MAEQQLRAVRRGVNGVAEGRVQPAQPAELARWRRGGHQIIPRPPNWAIGALAPWPDSAHQQQIDTDSLLARVADRGPGAPSPVVVLNPRRSAVLIAVFEGERGAEVLLTTRSWELSSHRGEVSFPGGRLDAGETPVQAALREAFEEVALDPADVTIVGELDHVGTIVSRSLIVPVVARLERRPQLMAAASEVSRIFTVPLVDLLRSDTYREEHWGSGDELRSLHFFDLDDETVWGATGRMLFQLLRISTAS